MKTFPGVFKNKKSLLFLSVFFLILLPVSSAHAGLMSQAWDGLTEAIMKVIYVVIGTVALYGAGLLARIGAFLVDVFLDPNLYDAVLRTGTAEDPTAIQVGWATVRDFCNMFYVFFLLLIAFATITRNQAYSAKNLLPKIVISMLLINFSMVITKIVIDFGQVFLFGIAGWMGTFHGPDGAAAGLTSVVDYFQDSFPSDRNPDKADIVVALFAVGYTLALALLYVILAGFLAIRLVYFVVLIIVSPFAFFSMVLPSMKTYASKWWHMLVNNAISGPIFMFFVYLSAVMAQNLTAPNYPVTDPSLNWIAGTIHILIPHFIALVMLWMAIPATQFIGAAGSKQLIGGTFGMGKAAALMGFGAAAGYKVGKGGLGWTGRRVGVDSDRVTDYARNKTINALDTVASKNKLGDRLTASTRGALTQQKANKQTEDRAEISKERGKITNYNADTSLTVMKGLQAKNIQGRATSADQKRMVALAEQAISKGASIDDIPEEVKSYMTANNVNLDELAKFNPYAAGKLKSRIDAKYRGAPDEAAKHAEDFVRLQADTGEFKKYTDDFRKNHFGLMMKHLDPKELESHIKNSGAKNKESYYYGADKALAGLVGSPDFDDAKVKVRKLTGNFEISDANRNASGGRLQIGGPVLGFGETATHAIDYNASLTDPNGAIKNEVGNNFQKLTTASQLAYFEHLNHESDVSGLQLKNMDGGTLRKMAATIKRRFPSAGHPIHDAALKHDVLGPFMK